MNTKRALFRTAAIVSILAASCIPTWQEGVWVLSSPLVLRSNNTGSSPSVLVVGDGLVTGIAEAAGGDGPQELADAIRFWSGRNTVVGAREDASLSHFTSKTLMAVPQNPQPPEPHPEESPLEVGLSALKPELTVLAVGSDDARILSTDGGRGAYRYTVGDYRGSLDTAVKLSLDSYSECVVLVNVADHWASTVSGPDLAAINNEIAEVVDLNPARVRLADWKTHSAGKEAWFTGPADIHLTQTGRVAYRDFIVIAVVTALNNGCSASSAVADEPTQQVLSTPAPLPSRRAEETDGLLQGAETGTDHRQTQ